MKNKKREKIHAKEKQSHAQDNIYVVQQFAYVHGVVGISLLSRKNTEYNLRLQYFSHTKTRQQHPKTLITKVSFHNELNGPKLKPPLHGLSLSKSPIKNHATLFGSGRVGLSNQIKQNQAPQSPTRIFLQMDESSYISNYDIFFITDSPAPHKNV